MIYYNTLSILKSYIKSLMIVIDGTKTSYSIERSNLWQTDKQTCRRTDNLTFYTSKTNLQKQKRNKIQTLINSPRNFINFAFQIHIAYFDIGIWWWFPGHITATEESLEHYTIYRIIHTFFGGGDMTWKSSSNTYIKIRNMYLKSKINEISRTVY